MFDDIDLPDFGKDKNSKNTKKNRTKKPKTKGLKSLGSNLGKGMFKGVAKMGGMALKAVPIIGLLATAGMAISDGIDGYQKTAENFNLKADQEATASEKFSSTLGGVVEGLSFGLLSSKDVATSMEQFTEDLGDGFDSYKSFMSMGLLGTDKDAKAVANKLDDSGVINKSFIGDSRINDWDAIKEMDTKDIVSLKKYDDWSDKDLKHFDEIIASKSTDVQSVDKEDLKAQADSKEVVTKVDEPIKPTTETTKTESQPQIIIQQPKESGGGTNIDTYSMDNNDLLTTMRLNGIDGV